MLSILMIAGKCEQLYGKVKHFTLKLMESTPVNGKQMNSGDKLAKVIGRKKSFPGRSGDLDIKKVGEICPQMGLGVFRVSEYRMQGQDAAHNIVPWLHLN